MTDRLTLTEEKHTAGRWTKQTLFGSPKSDAPGNCWAHCLAGWLNIPVEDVPDSIRFEPDMDKVDDTLRKFFANNGFACLGWNTGEWADGDWEYFWKSTSGALINVSGDSPRGDWQHAVIYKNGELYFDPHYSNDGIKRINRVEFVIPLDPALAK